MINCDGRRSNNMIRNELTFTPAIRPYALNYEECKKTIYFDIETTGLSAQASYVYLIGCAYADETEHHLIQWMTTDPSEEKELLRTFFDFLGPFSVLVHYNGTGFDLPFLEKKSKRHCLNSPLSSMQSVDLYRLSQKLKGFLSVENLKLKSMERFFGLSRTDTFSGGDLIEVYAKFLGLFKLNSITGGARSEEVAALTHVLLLHNAEDVMNLPALTVLQTLSEVYRFFETVELSWHRENHYLVFSAPVPFSLPKNVSLSIPFGDSMLTLDLPKDRPFAELCVIPYHGELKHFYPNYGDYFYLPAEDCAMHKSVAIFVDKEYRKKATAATCYTKKEGDFLPLRKLASSAKKEAGTDETVSFSCFQSDIKCSFQYTPLSDELLSDKSAVKALCHTLLKSVLTT